MTFTWDTEGIPPGEHEILILVDSGTIARAERDEQPRGLRRFVRPNAPYVEATKRAIDDGGVPTPGDTIRYEIEITNQGCADLPNGPGHEFTDTLPAGLTATGFVQATRDGGPRRDTIVWDGSIFAGGTVRIPSRRALNDVAPGTTLCNQGTVA
jgi:uncharacterized repeat protein (TIGR01451 family)